MHGVAKEKAMEDQIINQNNVFIVTEQIIQWMSVTLNMGILHGTNRRMNSSALIKTERADLHQGLYYLIFFLSLTLFLIVMKTMLIFDITD